MRLSWYETMRRYCEGELELPRATLVHIATLASEVDELERPPSGWIEVAEDFSRARAGWALVDECHRDSLRSMAFKLGAAADFSEGLKRSEKSSLERNPCKMIQALKRSDKPV